MGEWTSSVLRQTVCSGEIASSMNNDTYIEWSLLWIEFHVPGHCKDKIKLEVIALR